MNGPMRRVSLGLFIAFLVLALDVTYWQTIAAEGLREDPRNSRVMLTRSGRQRGQIISADTEVLARSVPDPSDPRYYVREYPHGSLYAHTVGFSSLLFGDSGIEASYATKLTSGRDLTVSSIINALLGQDLRARSLQLTLNHRLQETAARALGNRRGAVVALEPASGQILAMASSPTFDPNSLIGVDTDPAWEALGEDVARPLENRATGRSLPGEPLPEDPVLPGSDPAPDPSTALEIALRTAAIAREGRVMTPYLVARVFDGDSNLESETVPVLHSEPISTADAAVLADRMEQLAIHSARLGEVRGAGETGGGAGPTGRRQVWFSGYVPAGEPLIVVAVVVEPMTEAGANATGASEAASIGRAVIAAWLDHQDQEGGQER